MRHYRQNGGGGEQLTLGYDEFIGPMIEAIQELAAENTAFKRELADRLASVEARMAALGG